MPFIIRMKRELIAVPVFQDYISPLLDVSSRFAIFEIAGGEIVQKIVLSINEENELVKIDRLKELGVSTVISSAVSGHISQIICDRGLKLIPWISGPVDEIIDRYITNSPLPCCAGYPGGCPRRGSGAGRGNRRPRGKTEGKGKEEKK